MRNLISGFSTFAITTLSLLGTVSAQTYTSGHLSVTPTQTLVHDSTYCQSTYNLQYLITVDSSFVGDTVMVVDTALHSLMGLATNTLGASPWTFSMAFGTGTQDDFDLVPGSIVSFGSPVNKVVCRLDTVKYLVFQDSIAVMNPCAYGYISGSVYADNNNNCIFDSGDVGLNNLEIDINDRVSSPVDSIFVGITSSGAGYTYPIQQSWMTSYTVSMPSWLSFVLPFSTCFSGSYTFSTLPQTGVDFPLQCTSLVDVQAGILSQPAVRLHQPFFLNPYVSNFGCDSVSGVLTLIKDAHAIYDPSLSTFPADYVSGDTLQWTYSGLSNLNAVPYWNSFFSDIYLTPDSTLSVGDSMCFSVFATIPPTDVDSANNSASLCIPLVYSYDPNEKDVSPKGTGPEGFIPAGPDTLTYTLHFQNTGSDYAYNVSIIDTLDSHINASTLKVIGASATMLPKWDAPGVVEFDFNNIYLPDSSMSQPGSQGEVRFRVALNTGLTPGTQIRNTGYIYFDLNPPVVTNTTLNTITTPTKTNIIAFVKPVKVYPNPATDFVTVENLGDGQIDIFDVNGASVLHVAASGPKVQVAISALHEGVYMLRATNNNSTTTTRITKLQ